MQIYPVPKPLPGAEVALPDAPVCFASGANGLFKLVRNEFYTACVKLDGIPSLADLKEEAELHVPLLPLKLFRAVEGFFGEVYRRYQSEAVVLLYCNPNVKAWRVIVPPQQVRGLRVEYDLHARPNAPAGFQLFGSIHSHADIQAFHSGTDDADESGFDGLHITVGNLDKPIRSYACRWMLAGRAFKTDLAEVLEAEDLPAPDPAWLAQVSPAPVLERELFTPVPLGTETDERWCDLLGEPFASREEYLEHLEQMREEIEERLWAAEHLELEGGTHGSKR
ncbi:MAG: hypothetical protein HY291_21900 [Planctomycetes bacterium]|nr:hypothetical protein [Planctomycetota bacterium]